MERSQKVNQPQNSAFGAAWAWAQTKSGPGPHSLQNQSRILVVLLIGLGWGSKGELGLASHSLKDAM